MKNILQIKNLTISVEGKEVVKNLDLKVMSGQIYLLIGQNGSGKSSLVNLIAGHPKYQNIIGSVYLNNHDLTKLKPEQRAKQGIFISFQKAVEIPGVSTATVLRSSLNIIRKAQKTPTLNITSFYQLVRPYFKKLSLDPKFLNRDFNCGFSGGESKKIELIQYWLANPKLAIFDEIDSGLDIKSLKIIIDYIKNKKPKNQSILIITHNPSLIKSIKPDCVYKFK